MNTGTLYIISGASGTGKTSLAKAVVEALPNTKISVSHTTRPARVGEQTDCHYHFVTHDEFLRLIAQQAFLEYAQVFGYYYGTSKQWVTTQLATGIDIVLTIDWQGARQIKQQLECVSVFLLPPSLAALRQRLEQRGSENPELMTQRLAAASSEISHYKEFDYAIINDKFTDAALDLQAIIHSRRLRLQYQAINNSALINELTHGVK